MAANGFCVQKSCLPARLACKYVANIQDMIRGHRTGADGTKIPPDLDSMRSAGTRSHPATRPSPNFKTGVPARAGRRVRFPSASADQPFRRSGVSEVRGSNPLAPTRKALVTGPFLLSGFRQIGGSRLSPRRSALPIRTRRRLGLTLLDFARSSIQRCATAFGVAGAPPADCAGLIVQVLLDLNVRWPASHIEVTRVVCVK